MQLNLVVNITNCTFGGKNMDNLYVTSALKGMKISEIKRFNLSGSLFHVKTNVKGLITKQFKI